MEKTGVAIVGMGTVGSGVAKLLLDHGDRTARHAGRILWLENAVVRDLSKDRSIDLPKGILTDRFDDVIENPRVQVVALLVGGLEPARTFALRLLDAGKDLVTANKALLAEHGPELFDRARSLGRSIAFEASVAGGIPIIANISQCFSANQILSLRGILNGTSNYILTQMEEAGADYNTALRKAQELGYAEADPTMDVDGSDAAQKLAILAHLAFGARTHWRDIPRIGLDSFQLTDLLFAGELGYRIKLVASAALTNDGLELVVAPTLVKKGKPLAEVRSNYNAITVVGDAVGDVFFHGQGAGQMPTASAVVADMIDTAVGRTDITFRTLELWSNRASPVAMKPFEGLMSRYYLRLRVSDLPGVLAQITGILGGYGISIASLIQHEAESLDAERTVELVIMTHQAYEGSSRAALEAMKKLAAVHGEPIRLRVMD